MARATASSQDVGEWFNTKGDGIRSLGVVAGDST